MRRVLDAVHEEERRPLLHVLAILFLRGIAYETIKGALEERAPVCREGLDQRDERRGAYVVHRAREDLRRERDADQRRVAAVGSSVDRHLLRIGDPLIGGPLHPIDEVVVHGAGELLHGRVVERLPVAGGAPVVDLEHGVAAVREELRLGLISPRVAEPRAAVHQQHHRQVLRRHALREREVTVDREPVAGLEGDRPHLREVVRLQPRPRTEEEFRLPRLRVVQVGGSGIRRSIEGDDPLRLVARHGSDPGRPRVDLPERLDVALDLRLPRVDANRVGDVEGGEELVGALAEPRPVEVHLVLGIALDDRLLPGLQVEKDESRQVRVAVVARHVQATPIRMNADRPDVLFRRIGRHRAPLPGLRAGNVDLPAALEILAERDAHFVLRVEEVAAVPPRVLHDHLELGCLQVQPVRVEGARVPLVEPDEDPVGEVARHVEDERPHALKRREVLRLRRPRAGDRYRIDVVVLVPGLVLDVEEPRGVLGPEVGDDGPRRVGGHDALGLRPDRAQVNIQLPLIGLQVREPLPVGRDLRARDLRVVEELLQRDERRLLRLGTCA